MVKRRKRSKPPVSRRTFLGIVAVSLIAVLALLVTVMGNEIKEGDTVSVHYKGSLDDGTVFDSSEGREPLQFTVGEHQVIPGFENAVLGKNKGNKITVNIPAADAYGTSRPELIRDFPKDTFGENIPKEGDQVVFTAQNGQQVPGIVLEVKENDINVDLNHPLAGKDLNFEIEIVDIN